jgi:hypothetical protein
MAILRFISLGIMMAAVVVGMALEPIEGLSSPHPPYIASTRLIGLEGFALVFSTCLFAQMFQVSAKPLGTPSFACPRLSPHARALEARRRCSRLYRGQHSVPGLIQPLDKCHRRYVRPVFTAALGTTLVLYLLLGLLCGLYFGRSLEPAVNLNFARFRWGLAVRPGDPLPWYLQALSQVSQPAPSRLT